MIDKLLTLEQVAEQTGFSVATLYRFLAPSGDLACVRTAIGSSSKRRTRGAIRILESDLNAWILRHRVVPHVELRRVASGRFG